MRSIFNKTRSPIAKWKFMLFGLSETFDGLVIFLSLGMLTSDVSMKVISYFTIQHFRAKGKNK